MLEILFTKYFANLSKREFVVKNLTDNCILNSVLIKKTKRIFSFYRIFLKSQHMNIFFFYMMKIQWIRSPYPIHSYIIIITITVICFSHGKCFRARALYNPNTHQDKTSPIRSICRLVANFIVPCTHAWIVLLCVCVCAFQSKYILVRNNAVIFQI